MKTFLQLMLIVLSLGQIQAQTDSSVFSSISVFFQQNDYEKLAAQFAETLDLTIGDTDGTYGKQQATILIKSFFGENKTTSFIIKHKGSSNERTHYAVCDLKSGNKNWSVYILLGKNSKIIQLQIEE